MHASGYVLRIATRAWVNNVFDMAIYYTNLRRKWKVGQAIIFVHRTENGDAIVGHGVVENACEREELSEEEKGKNAMPKWKRAILFKYVIRFNKPLPTRETFLGDPKFRGRYCHGIALNKEQIDRIIAQAESLQPRRNQKA